MPLLIPVITILMLLMIAPCIINYLAHFVSSQVNKLPHAVPIQQGYIKLHRTTENITHSQMDTNGNPLQYSCLENSMDGGVWWATVYGVAKSRTRLSDFNQEPVKVRFQGGVYPRLTKSESSRVEPWNLHSNMLPGDSDMAQTLDNQEPFI